MLPHSPLCQAARVRPAGDGARTADQQGLLHLLCVDVHHRPSDGSAWIENHAADRPQIGGHRCEEGRDGVGVGSIALVRVDAAFRAGGDDVPDGRLVRSALRDGHLHAFGGEKAGASAGDAGAAAHDQAYLRDASR